MRASPQRTLPNNIIELEPDDPRLLVSDVGDKPDDVGLCFACQHVVALDDPARRCSKCKKATYCSTLCEDTDMMNHRWTCGSYTERPMYKRIDAFVRQTMLEAMRKTTTYDALRFDTREVYPDGKPCTASMANGESVNDIHDFRLECYRCADLIPHLENAPLYRQNGEHLERMREALTATRLLSTPELVKMLGPSGAGEYLTAGTLGHAVCCLWVHRHPNGETTCDVFMSVIPLKRAQAQALQLQQEKRLQSLASTQ